MARLQRATKLFVASTLVAAIAVSAEAGGAPVRDTRSHRDAPLVVSTVVNRTRAAQSEAALRGDLADALESTSFDGVPAGKHYLLKASLTELERAASGARSITTSTFEVAVVDGSTSKIVGIVRGHAKVEAASSDPAADEAAVRAAAQHAVESAVVVARGS